MNEPFLISVIVPVYKVERYIVQCADSILAQTYTNFELILVDDGSPDRCGEICDEYVRKDNRVKVLHQQNVGPSCCRNRGIEIASGTYVCFIDSDDWVDSDYLATMVGELKDDVDLVVSGFVLEKKDRKILKGEARTFTMQDKDAFHSLTVHRLLLGPCQKIFALSIIREHCLSFPENIRYGEDRLFNYAYLRHVNRIVSVDRAAYHYRIHENGSLASRIYPNMFDLEYSQWKDLYQLYMERDLLTEESQRYLWREFYWLTVDNMLSADQWNIRKTWRDKYTYLQGILSVPEIREVKKYKHWLKDAPELQFRALTRGWKVYFCFIHIIRKKKR